MVSASNGNATASQTDPHQLGSNFTVSTVSTVILGSAAAASLIVNEATTYLQSVLIASTPSAQAIAGKLIALLSLSCKIMLLCTLFVVYILLPFCLCYAHALHSIADCLSAAKAAGTAIGSVLSVAAIGATVGDSVVANAGSADGGGAAGGVDSLMLFGHYQFTSLLTEVEGERAQSFEGYAESFSWSNFYVIWPWFTDIPGSNESFNIRSSESTSGSPSEGIVSGTGSSIEAANSGTLLPDIQVG